MTTEWASGNFYIRRNTLARTGDRIDGHKHDFDHTSIVFTGAVRVVRSGPGGERDEREFRAPAHFLVLKDWLHEITALEDETVVWCCYAHRDAQGEIVLEHTGWNWGYR